MMNVNDEKNLGQPFFFFCHIIFFQQGTSTNIYKIIVLLIQIMHSTESQIYMS